MSKFVISYERKRYHFELVTASGEVLLTSNGFDSWEQCEAGIACAVKHSQRKRNFSCQRVDESKWFFCLSDATGEPIGSSENYVTYAGLRKAIRAVKKHSVIAQIVSE